MKNDDVFSWAEVVADPEDALKHLVVIEGSLDTASNMGERINNRQRMQNVSTLSSIVNSALSSGRGMIILTFCRWLWTPPNCL